MFRLLIALLLPVALLAGQGSPPAAKTPRAVRRGRIEAHLHRVRMERLQQALGISADKARTIADRWARFDLDSQDNRQRMKQLHQEVNAILMSPLPEEEKNTRIRPLVAQFSLLRDQQQEQRHTFEEDIRSTLTPAQQGRFLLLVEEIQRALVQAIKQQRSGPGSP